MTSASLIRRASVALMALSLAACGDSTGPNTQLTEAQVTDMLDAMSAVSSFGPVPGTALAVLTTSATVDCPNGGSASVSTTINANDAGTSATVAVTQGFSGCKATSESGRVWTFNGNPNITTNLSMTANQTTGAFTMTGTQKGGIKFASDLGSGSCAIDLTLTLSGDQTSFSGTLSGTACGHTIQQSISLSQ